MQGCKLKHAVQNDKSVRDYLAELNGLFNTIGLIDERKKVHKLWSGLNIDIQKGLWREKLNLEYSTYNDVAAAAELVEIIDNVSSMNEQYSEHESDDSDSMSNSENHSKSDNEDSEPCRYYSDNQYNFDSESDDSAHLRHHFDGHYHMGARTRMGIEVHAVNFWNERDLSILLLVDVFNAVGTDILLVIV